MFFIDLPLVKVNEQLNKKIIMTTDNDEKNWSQIKETILMINVAVARIEHAMIEGDDSFTSLSQTFVETFNAAKDIALSSDELDDSAIKSKIKKDCGEITQRVNDSIIAFQFYDKLSQRMALVSKTLGSLTEILENKSKTNSQNEWKKLQDMIRSKYTLDADQEMFDAVLKGVTIEDALKIAVKKTHECDIEFF